MPMVVKKRKAVMDPLPISPMKIVARGPNNEGGRHVEAARANLFHALSHGTLDSAPSSSRDDNETSNQEVPETDFVELPLPQKLEPALLKRKKKLSKTEEERQAFVMKLFDRSVDLALFKESTPLYPICRAWMQNMPKKVNSDSDKSSKKDGADNEKMEVDEDPNAIDVEGILNSLSSAEEVELKMLPLPEPLVNANDRIPSPISVEKSELDLVLSLDQDSEELPSKEDLLKEHREKWVTIRKNWHATERRNEDRYKDSRTILDTVYNKAQKHYQ